MRWYDKQKDGPINVQMLGVFFNDLGSPNWGPFQIDNVT
eukprot:COSAG05_NODE_19254_length_295_cov_1.045918_1_plen_38_part_10